MKSLFLVRHAKSSRDELALADRERPLNQRGVGDATAMGKRLIKHRVRPDLMLSSPALRALSTAQLIAAEIGYPRKHILVDDQLYAARVADLLAVIHGTDKKIDRLMLVGHNPEFSELASRLTGEPVDMSTCAVAEFTYEGASWADIGVAGPARFTLEQPKK